MSISGNTTYPVPKGFIEKPTKCTIYTIVAVAAVAVVATAIMILKRRRIKYST